MVSIGEKTLPTNPSARDRRALQTTVANKIRKNQQSQRRRCSDDDMSMSSLSPLSSQGATPTKSYVSSSSISTPSNTTATGTSRKRQAYNKDNNNNENNDSNLNSSNSNKRNRNSNNNSNNSSTSTSKKQRLSNPKLKHNSSSISHSSSHNNTINNSNTDPDEAETIEKRNLHNNMERQRRIGLKNLFEELKKEIPSLKDKERAPKVNILREASTYCSKLKQDDDLRTELLNKQAKLIKKMKSLRNQLGPQLATQILAQRKY